MCAPLRPALITLAQEGPARRHRILGPIIGRPFVPGIVRALAVVEDGGRRRHHRRRPPERHDSTVTACFEDLELMSDRPMRRPWRRLRNADTGERMIYVA